MKSKLSIKFLAVILIVSALFVFTACGDKNDTPPTHDNALTSKVVLFIGDGMGPDHVYNTELYTGETMYFSSFATKTTVDTNSLSGVTDSAASATAMATGQRVKNDTVAMGTDGKAIMSITELAKNDKYGTGVVTSDDITGATPAGFSGHAKKRNNSAEILLSQKENQLDLLLGSGNHPTAYKNLFEEKGWTWVTKFSEISLEQKRFVATFTDVSHSDPTDEKPSLTQLATFAIDYMEAHYPTGYFLMIEGAKIDKASHSGDVSEMIANTIDFNSAIKSVDQKLSATGSGYSIIVTADHETGGLQRAENKDAISDDLYTTTGHTDTKVGLYFKSTLEVAPELLNKEVILNTEIFLLCKQLLGIA